MFAIETNGKRLIRIYFRDGTYRTVGVGPETESKDVCNFLAKKLNLSGSCFQLLETVNNSSRIVDGNEKILNLHLSHLKNGISFGESKQNAFCLKFTDESWKRVKKRLEKIKKG